jgi:Fe-S-cluster containining protein
VDGVEDILANPELEHRSEEDFIWILTHWEPVGLGKRWLASDGKWYQDYKYRCKSYDPVHALCTAHDDRPPVCRHYPWYSQGPTRAKARKMGGQCSYLLDVPPANRPAGSHPLIPITAVSHDQAFL